MKHDASILVPDSLQRIPHSHVDCGRGGAANGLRRATARFGDLMIEKVACSGIIDVPLPPLDEPEGHMATVISSDSNIAFDRCNSPPEWHRTTPAGLHRPAARMVREDVRRAKCTVLGALDGCGGKRVTGTSVMAMDQPPPVYARNSGIYPTLHAMGDNELRNMRSAPKTVTSTEKLWLVRPFAPLPTQRVQSESSRRYGEWHKATRAAQQETDDAKVLHWPREG